ncbi:hypothetical protein KCU91_g139, partial [Aureobasidium melanogenum]
MVASLSRILYRPKLSASFKGSSIATYRTTTTRHASKPRSVHKTHSQESLTTIKQLRCMQTADPSSSRVATGFRMTVRV